MIGIGLDKLQTIPPAFAIRQELEIIGSYSMERAEIESVINLVSNARLDMSRSITERLPLEKANLAIEHLKNKTGNPVRIVINQD